MGETVALYSVWDPSSVKHYLETALPKPQICSFFFHLFLSLKAPVTSPGRFPLWGTPCLYSEEGISDAV